MPPFGKEVQLTDIEVKLMSIFVKEQILSDRHCAIILQTLADKLEGVYDPKDRVK